MFALVAALILPFAGCLGEEESSTTASTRSLDVKWTEIPLEAKSEYYSDEEAVSWQLSSDLVEQDIQNAGGIIVGISMMLDYPNEDESPNVGLCTGLEDNVEDIIYGTVSKNDWTLTQNDVNPGSHVVNLTWHNQSLLEMKNISGMSDDEIMQQIDFGMDAYGAYDFTIMVDADAFNGNFCTHTDNGEQVSSSISLLVLDVAIEGSSDVAALSVGDGTVSIVLFAPWFVGMFLLVGYLVSQERALSPWCDPRRRIPCGNENLLLRRQNVGRKLSCPCVDPLCIVCRSRNSLGIHHCDLRDVSCS